MACDTVRTTPRQTAEERRTEVRAALKALEARLLSGALKVVVDRASGAVAFVGWQGGERRGLTDACAYRTLSASSSWALKQAVAKAEAAAGRRVDARAVTAGVHSHDGGATWGRH